MTKNAGLGPVVSTLLNTFKVAQVTYVDYTVTSDFGLGPIILSLASFDAKDVGLLSSGPMSMNDFKVKAMGTDAFTMQSISGKKMSIPDAISPMLKFGDNPYLLQTQAPAILIEKLKKEPMVIEGLALKGLHIGNGLIPEPVTLDSFTFDMNIGADAMLFKTSVSNLVLPPSVMKQMDSEFASFAAVYGKPLNLSGLFDFNLTRKGDSAGFTVSGNFSDASLGNGQGKGEFSFPVPGTATAMEAMPGADDPLLHSVTLNLKDTGFLPVFFDSVYAYESRYGFEDEHINSGADMRRDAAEECFKGAKDASSQEEAALATGFGNFIQKGGSLNITVTTAKPLPISTLEYVEELPKGALTVVVEHSE